MVEDATVFSPEENTRVVVLGWVERMCLDSRRAW